MKRTSMVIDEKLIKEGMKATGIKTRRALVDYALRELLCRESPKRILELKEKERIHHEGYKRKAVKLGEFGDWEAEQVWVEP
jgi:Arc/MetJ family transcription regulator